MVILWSSINVIIPLFHLANKPNFLYYLDRRIAGTSGYHIDKTVSIYDSLKIFSPISQAKGEILRLLRFFRAKGQACRCHSGTASFPRRRLGKSKESFCWILQ